MVTALYHCCGGQLFTSDDAMEGSRQRESQTLLRIEFVVKQNIQHREDWNWVKLVVQSFRISRPEA